MKKYLYLIFVCLLLVGCTKYKITYLDGNSEIVTMPKGEVKLSGKNLVCHCGSGQVFKTNVAKFEEIIPKESTKHTNSISNSDFITHIIVIIISIFILLYILYRLKKPEYIWCTKSDRDAFIVGKKYEIIEEYKNRIHVRNSLNLPAIITKSKIGEIYYQLTIGHCFYDRTSITFSRTNPNEQINNMPARYSHGGFNGTKPEKSIKKLKNMSLLNKIIIYVMKIGIIIILIKVFLILIQQIPTILNNLLLQWKI